MDPGGPVVSKPTQINTNIAGNGENCDINTPRRSSTGRRLPQGPSFDEPVTFHYEIQNHTSRMQRIGKAFKVYRLAILTLVCVALGIVVGLWCRAYAHNWPDRKFMYIRMPGELYLRMLKLMILPLLVSNVILSFGSFQGKLSSHLGKIASCLYVATNLVAIIIAICIVLLFSPGYNPQLARPTSAVIPTDGSHQPRALEPAEMQNMSARHSNTTTSVDPPVLNSNKSTRQSAPQKQPRHESATSNGPPPSGHNALASLTPVQGASLPMDILLDILRNLIPENLVSATMTQTRTRLLAPRDMVIVNGTKTDPPPSHWPIRLDRVEQPNIIGLLAISVLTGVVLSQMDDAARPLLELCACISELSLRISILFINLTPICIGFLLVEQVAKTRDLTTKVSELCMYIGTVSFALVLHGFVVLPLVFWIYTRRSPFGMLAKLVEPLVAAFASSSSSATIALLLSGLVQCNLNPMVVRAFGPLGSVFNMNGTTIYEVVACIFLAQSIGLELPLTSVLLVGVTSAIAGLSTVGIPSSGMMTIVIVLDSVSLPVQSLGLIFIVDFIIDRFRTVVNVWSGALVCALIDHMCPEHLLDEFREQRKFLELIKNRQLVNKNNAHNNSSSTTSFKKDSLCKKPKGNRDSGERKSQIISVTITPPPPTTPSSDKETSQV